MHCDFAQYKQSLRSFQDLKQKGQAPILIIVGILAAVLIASGAYYLGRSTSPKPSPIPVVSQTPRSTPDTSPTPTGAGTSGTPNGVAETANWKTYTNTKVGFRISYPPRYGQPQLPRGQAISPPLYADGTEDNANIIFGETSTDSLSVIVFPFQGNLEEILTSDQAKGIPPYNWTPAENILLTSKDLLVDGVNAKWITTSYKMGVKDTYTAIFFTKEGFGFIINSSPNHEEKEIDQILSTFKFLD